MKAKVSGTKKKINGTTIPPYDYNFTVCCNCTQQV